MKRFEVYAQDERTIRLTSSAMRTEYIRRVCM